MDENHWDLYMYSVYWCVQTLTSVGYGDLTFAKTEAELVLCLVWMAFGVAYYTFVVGNFTSMIANNDILKEKLEVRRANSQPPRGASNRWGTSRGAPTCPPRSTTKSRYPAR